MVLRQRSYDIDDLWQLIHQADNDHKHYELIDGELFEMSPPGLEHGTLASEIVFFIRLFNQHVSLGIVTVETGYHPPDDRSILLSPDVAFTSKARIPQPISKKFAPFMPDLAVEIVSPSNSLKQVRRKAAIYLHNGTQLVWIVLPDERAVEVCRLDPAATMQFELVNEHATLSGDPVLPGFELNLKRLFKSLR